MRQVYVRARDRTIELLELLAGQRGESPTDLRNRAMEIGAKLLAISGPPEYETGWYGNYSSEELAHELRPWVLLLNDFLQQQHMGVATQIQDMPSVERTHELQQQANASIPTVDEEAFDTFGGFGTDI